MQIPSTAIIDDLCKAVKAKNNLPGYLKDIPSAALKVFKHKDELGGEPLDEETSVSGLGEAGKRKKDALLVLVPGSCTSSHSLLQNRNGERLNGRLRHQLQSWENHPGMHG